MSYCSLKIIMTGKIIHGYLNYIERGMLHLKKEYKLDELNQEQMEILIEYLIKSNSYGEDCDPQNIDDLIQYDILTPVNTQNLSVTVKNMRKKD